MAASAGTVTLELDANSIKLIRELNKAQKQTKRTSTRMSRDMKRAFATMAKSAATFGVAMAAATKLSINFADKIAKTADKIGVNVEALQELRFAAQRAGVEQRTLDMALQRFTRRAGEAAIGTGEAKAAIEQMGLQLRDSSGNLRSTDDLLRDVADAFKETADPAERLRLAFKLFDSEGAALVNMLSDGSEGLNAVTQEARDLGVVMKESLVRDAERAANKMGDLQRVLQIRIASTVVENADAVVALADAVMNLVIATSKAATSVPAFMEWVGESVAAAIHGPALDDFIRREDEIYTLEKRLAKHQKEAKRNAVSRDGVLYMRPGERAYAIELQRVIDLKKESLRIDREAFSANLRPSGGGGGIAAGLDPSGVQGDATQVTAIIASMMQEIKTFGMTDSEKALINIIDEGATEDQIALFKQVQEELRLLTEAEAIANAELEEIVVTAKRRADVVSESVNQMTEFGVQAARNLQTAFADFLFDPFDEGLGNMAKNFAKMIQRMAAEAAAAAILNALFGALAGSSNSVLSGFGKALSGARAEGGPVSAGGAYLVGEKGPEIIVPRSAGTVIPNGAVGGSSVVVNIDARESDNPGRLLALVPVIQAQVEASITKKSRRGYL